MQATHFEHSPLQYCEERGIVNPDTRILSYGTVADWLVNQYEGKAQDTLVRDDLRGLIADFTIAGAFFDKRVDSVDLTQVEEVFEAALFTEDPKSSNLFSSIYVPDLAVDGFNRRMAGLDQDDVQSILTQANLIIVAMRDHYYASRTPDNVAERLVTRAHEAIALAGLYSTILSVGTDDFFRPYFTEWLELQLISGNLWDSLFDHQMDVEDGQAPLTLQEKLIWLKTTLNVSGRFVAHPMTTKKDVSLMLNKLSTRYCLPLIKKTLSPRLQQLR